VFLDACTVCDGRTFAPLWKLPQNKLSKVAYLDAPETTMNRLYLAYLPLLTVPQEIFCFDICADCQSIFLNPKSDDQAVYERDGSKVRNYKSRGVEEFRSQTASVQKWIPEDAKVIVDAACGAGQAITLLREWKPEIRYIGLELSRPSVEFMREELGFEAHAVDLDRDDLDFVADPGTVDFVLLEEAFEHVRSPMVVMRKMVRMLKPGGRMHFTAQRYGDNELPIRVGEPIYINDDTLEWVVKSLGLEMVEIVKDIKFRIVVEKPGGPPRAAGLAPELTVAHSGSGPHFSDPDATAINDIARKVLEARESELGSDGAGLYDYYSAMLKRGIVLQDYEVSLADAVLASTSPDAPILDIGAGVGVLAAYFAAKGRTVITLEHDRRRQDSARAFFEAFAAANPDAAARIDLRAGTFPVAGMDLPSSGVALFTNITGGASEAQRDAMVNAVRPFSWVVFDAQRFLIRHRAGEALPNVQAFWRAGFRRMRPLVDLGLEAEYYLVEGPATPQ
jgi:SAM-dependent methyltransferase